MPRMRFKVNIDNKYTYISHEGGGSLCLRYGENWKTTTGDNLLLSMAYEIAIRRELDVLRRRYNLLNPGDAIFSPRDKEVRAETKARMDRLEYELKELQPKGENSDKYPA